MHFRFIFWWSHPFSIASFASFRPNIESCLDSKAILSAAASAIGQSVCGSQIKSALRSRHYSDPVRTTTACNGLKQTDREKRQGGEGGREGGPVCLLLQCRRLETGSVFIALNSFIPQFIIHFHQSWIAIKHSFCFGRLQTFLLATVVVGRCVLFLSTPRRRLLGPDQLTDFVFRPPPPRPAGSMKCVCAWSELSLRFCDYLNCVGVNDITADRRSHLLEDIQLQGKTESTVEH